MTDIVSIFAKFPPLQTERLILRELTFDDLPDLAEMNNDTDILNRIHYGVRYGAFDTLTHAYGLFNTKQAVTWGIVLKENNKLIGIRMCFIDSEHEPVTIQGQIKKHFRKQGYTAEAYLAIIDFLQKAGVKAIKANTEKNNLPAIGLLKKLGFDEVTTSYSSPFLDPNPSAILFTKNIEPILRPTPVKKQSAINRLVSFMAKERAHLYYIKNEFDKANDEIDKVLASQPEDSMLAECFLLKGMITKAKHGNLRAIDYFEEAISLNPSLAKAHTLLGLCQYNLSMRPDAHSSWTRAVELGDAEASDLINNNF